MTFKKKLEMVAEIDPAFVQSVRRLRVALWVFGTAIILAILLAVWGIAVNFGQQTEIRKVQSACAEDPDGKVCQEVKRAADLARSLGDSCIPFYQVDSNGELLQLTRCPPQR